MLVISELARGQELLEVVASWGATSSMWWSHQQTLLCLLYFTYGVTRGNYPLPHMLPVTCVLTCKSAMVKHKLQIWNTGTLNCMTSPIWFNKTQAAVLQSCVCLSLLLQWTSLDVSVTSNHYLSCHVAVRRPAREARGNGGGGSLSFHWSCGISKRWWRPSSKSQWPHWRKEVINEVR